MAEAIGSLLVKIGADVTSLVGGFNAAGKESDKIQKKFDDVIDTAKTLGAAIGTAGVAAAAGIAVFLKNTINTADELGKMAQRVGFSVESLSALKYGGELAGVSMESLTTGLKQFSKSLDQGDDAFRRLIPDMSMAQIRALGNEKAFALVVERLSNLKDGFGKTAMTMEFFGKSGADLIPLVNGGAKGLSDLADEARRAGVIISTETAKAAEDFNDNITRLTAQLQGMGVTLAGPVIRNLSTMTNQMVAAREATESWLQALKIGFSSTPVAERIVDINAQLDKLKNKQADLEKNGQGGPVRFLGTPLENTKRQIAALEAELATLMKTRETLNAQEAAADEAKVRRANAKDAPAPIDKAAEAAAKRAREQAAREAAAAAKKALDDAHKQMEDMARVELEGEAELRALRADWAAGEKEEQDKKYENARLALEQLQASLMTEREAINAEHAERLAVLEEARIQGLVSLEQYEQSRQAIVADSERKLTALSNSAMTERETFAQLSYRRQAKTIFGELANITAGVAQHSRKLFEINKVAGIANAILNAYEGISLTMAKYPFPINVAMAAAHGAAAFAQVNAIRSSTFSGGGGAAPSIAGSTAATPVSPVGSGAPAGAGGGQTTFLKIDGEDVFSGKTLRRLAANMIEAQKKGTRFVLV